MKQKTEYKKTFIKIASSQPNQQQLMEQQLQSPQMQVFSQAEKRLIGELQAVVVRLQQLATKNLPKVKSSLNKKRNEIITQLELTGCTVTKQHGDCYVSKEPLQNLIDNIQGMSNFLGSLEGTLRNILSTQPNNTNNQPVHELNINNMNPKKDDGENDESNGLNINF